MRSIAASLQMEYSTRLAMLIGLMLFLAIPVKAQTQPSIVGSPLRWITSDDYPSAALHEGREGRASYMLTIDASGRVCRCEITASSGHADLDAKTCDLLSRRARFAKTKETGQPRYFKSMFSWNIVR